ncbi:muskelin 1 [Capsaspora owczarzaki ATCC 30864]|uniref:muskelin 1 n=1 Tax=Capsaspora owczarzaki (strain ATCC 30864) TaxID=595528 RepID=UPI0003526756|nr:muskelin 1 [Capsaspora owczarzaki ATCC 30864]|eukprot:XP_004345468.2 muskelin 1 [Capsaspora owczarzaki ATCC 30864]
MSSPASTSSAPTAAASAAAASSASSNPNGVGDGSAGEGLSKSDSEPGEHGALGGGSSTGPNAAASSAAAASTAAAASASSASSSPSSSAAGRGGGGGAGRPVPWSRKHKPPATRFQPGEVLGASSSSSSSSSSASGQQQTQVLPYSIDSCSSYSAQYLPTNILVDNPTDQSSRWSSNVNNHMQFLMLKLAEPSVVKSITLGKYHKVHVCNVREFKVFGGMTTENMEELLHSGLKNDTEAETLLLKHSTNNIIFPCQYIKIVPVMAWGPNFNFSIWYVQLKGLPATPRIVQEFDNFRERQAVRLCLKYLRQKNHMEAFESLQQRTSIRLEDPMLTELHELVVMQGDFDKAEQTMLNAIDQDLFAEYIFDSPWTPMWKRLVPVTQEGHVATRIPGPRGGHQMCLDERDGVIYLFGGWDGSRELGDFWAYKIAQNQWTCLADDASMFGGPSARSCHKMCLNTKSRQLFVLGRYMESDISPASELTSDFYMYDIDSATWQLIAADTWSAGGPSLAYDFQMAYDPVTDCLFAYGGRVVLPTTVGKPDIEQTITSQRTNTLFMYDCANGAWSSVLNLDDAPQLKARIEHSMVLDPEKRLLYIFANRRLKEQSSDLLTFNLDTHEVSVLLDEIIASGGPETGFAHRSTIDPVLGEIYIVPGPLRDLRNNQEVVNLAFWLYSTTLGRWRRVYRTEVTDVDHWQQPQPTPRPRIAHQLVHDSATKTHYLFGGNPGDRTQHELRLDDLWSFKIERLSHDTFRKRCMFLIRQQKYREMCAYASSMEALRYLQTDLAATVNHNNPVESANFRALSAALFQRRAGSGMQDASFSAAAAGGMEPSDTFGARSKLFEELASFFPSDMRQPSINIVDLLSL